MSHTKSGVEIEKKIAAIGNGAKLVFDGIAEYEALPKCDRREYVMRLLGLYQMALKGAKDREDLINGAHRKLDIANENLHQIRSELVSVKSDQSKFKKSLWYRVYKIFNK